MSAGNVKGESAMGTRMNCWEVKKCCRTDGGEKVAEMGACPAANDMSYEGVNGGKNGGRVCWAITGTLCGGKVQGTFAQKRVSCMTCDFFIKVKEEESQKFELFR